MKEPRFSIVIPAYNSPATVGSAIESVLGQNQVDLELVVVDDGSTDGITPGLIEEHVGADPRARLVTQENQGVAGARNTGIAATRGRYVSFLDDDDLWLPSYLEQMGEALDADSGAGLAYTDGWSLDHATRRIFKATAMSGSSPPLRPPDSLGEFIIRVVERNFILSSSTVRRDVLEAVGGFDAAVSGVDDFDLWLRILCAGYRAVRTRDILVIQRERSDSQSKDRLLMAAALREVLRRVAEVHPDVPAQARRSAESQVRALDREISGLTGESHLVAAQLGLARTVSSLWRRLRGPRPTYDEPPAAVASAFPDLWRV
jgi:glycosyltransferase involved in cell wall biosynthesis